MATLPTVCKRPEPWIEQDFASLEKMVVFKYSEFGSFLGGKDQRSRLNNFFFFEFGIFVVVEDKHLGLDKTWPYREIFKYDMDDYDDDENI